MPLRRLLVANRGEIAARIISSARELDLATIAVYSDDDIGHTYNAAEVAQLSSSSAYLDIDELVKIAKRYSADTIHPGYGFLSESAEFAHKAHQAGILVVGPGSDILSRTGDKLRARALAQECGVPVLPALLQPTGSVDSIKIFAAKHGLPIMVKAVDGGGGRGIRLIRTKDELESATSRAIEESPSRQVFAERAAIDGFRHVEVQIIGDNDGNIMHLWERECSIQRRFQKVIEVAPSMIDRAIVQPVIDAAVLMAKQIKYRSLGTFEFLLNPDTTEFFFLEVNPRLQVEHTITESVCGVDIVRAQLLLAQGANFEQAGLHQAQEPPQQHSIQLRLTAEDPAKNWTLSPGNISSFRLPSGNGVRVDTSLSSGGKNTVSANFDSVIAKIILTAASWPQVVSKARRALEDTEIAGIKTNLGMLSAIVTHPDFIRGRCDTQWLGTNQSALLSQSLTISTRKPKNELHNLSLAQGATSPVMSLSTASTLFRKDDAWSITLSSSQAATTSQSQQSHLRLVKVLKNDFPSTLSAHVAFTAPHSTPVKYHMDLQATSASASALSAQHRRGDPKDSSHVILPFAGKLVELCVEQGDVVKKGDCIAVVQQMKMELEVRSPHDGVVTWTCNIDDGEDVSEGLLAAVIVQQHSGKSRL